MNVLCIFRLEKQPWALNAAPSVSTKLFREIWALNCLSYCLLTAYRKQSPASSLRDSSQLITSICRECAPLNNALHRTVKVFIYFEKRIQSSCYSARDSHSGRFTLPFWKVELAFVVPPLIKKPIGALTEQGTRHVCKPKLYPPDDGLAWYCFFTQKEAALDLDILSSKGGGEQPCFQIRVVPAPLFLLKLSRREAGPGGRRLHQPIHQILYFSVFLECDLLRGMMIK